MSNELKALLARVHTGITTFDFEGKDIPCIVIKGKRYDKMLSKIAGQSLSVDTNLDILQDGLGNVFVEIALEFSKGGIAKKFLVNAKTDMKFFECLAETSMLALSSPESELGKNSVFIVQMPRPEKARGALEIIRKGLGCNDKDDAVTGI